MSDSNNRSRSLSKHPAVECFEVSGFDFLGVVRATYFTKRLISS